MSEAKGGVPEFGKFGEAQNAGFTGMFEVKKKARREQQDDLEFPEPMEPLQEERQKKAKPQDAEGKKKKKKKKKQAAQPQGGCCTIS